MKYKAILIHDTVTGVFHPLNADIDHSFMKYKIEEPNPSIPNFHTLISFTVKNNCDGPIMKYTE